MGRVLKHLVMAIPGTGSAQASPARKQSSVGLERGVLEPRLSVRYFARMTRSGIVRVTSVPLGDDAFIVSVASMRAALSFIPRRP
jgi:hypothetical protein